MIVFPEPTLEVVVRMTNLHIRDRTYFSQYTKDMDAALSQTTFEKWDGRRTIVWCLQAFFEIVADESFPDHS